MPNVSFQAVQDKVDEKMKDFQKLLNDDLKKQLSLKDEELEEELKMDGFFVTEEIVKLARAEGLQGAKFVDPIKASSEEGKKDAATQDRLMLAAAANLDGTVNAKTLFEARIEAAVNTFNRSEGKKEDVEAFEKAFKAANDIYALAFRKYGDATLVDKVKAAGMAVLGVIVTLLTSPAFLMPKSIHDHSQWLKNFHFFVGAETDKSKAAQAEMDDKFISDLVAAPGA
ncbi:MAG: hypothetical protein P1U32_02235 [Legionellaceae bacterium]|nr:hypothetical protein [Legionellaceae bacterium]